MRTRIFEIKSKKDDSKIDIAADIINKGGLVAFPTETVYGLGANALDSKAVEKIFIVKKRPKNDPLIVHIADKADLDKIGIDISEKTRILIDKFWPGPLTVLVKRNKNIPGIVSAELDSVAVRFPSNRIARALIEKSKVPIVAPSANLFGRPSPTDAQHVLEDLNKKIDVILDGGSTDIGLESTIVDCTSQNLTILRPGGIIVEQIKKVIGKVELKTSLNKNEIIKSPGQGYKHYSPRAKVIVVKDSEETVKKIREFRNKKIGLMLTKDITNIKVDFKIILGEDKKEIARNLFKNFREFDNLGIEVIILEAIDDKGLGLAIMDRVSRAAL